MYVVGELQITSELSSIEFYLWVHSVSIPGTSRWRTLMPPIRGDIMCSLYKTFQLNDESYRQCLSLRGHLTEPDGTSVSCSVMPWMECNQHWDRYRPMSHSFPHIQSVSTKAKWTQQGWYIDIQNYLTNDTRSNGSKKQNYAQFQIKLKHPIYIESFSKLLCFELWSIFHLRYFIFFNVKSNIVSVFLLCMKVTFIENFVLTVTCMWAN